MFDVFDHHECMLTHLRCDLDYILNLDKSMTKIDKAQMNQRAEALTS